MTVKEASEATGIAAQTLRRRIGVGQIDASVNGNRWLIHLRSLAKYLGIPYAVLNGDEGEVNRG